MQITEMHSRLLVRDARANGSSRRWEEEGMLQIRHVGDEERVAQNSALTVGHLLKARQTRLVNVA